MITVTHHYFGSFVTQGEVHGKLSALDAHYHMGMFPPQYPVPVTAWIAETIVLADRGSFIEASLYEDSTFAPEDWTIEG